MKQQPNASSFFRGTIYKITNDTNGRIYVGATVRNPKDRWREHIQSNDIIGQAIVKDGLDHFQFEPIEEGMWTMAQMDDKRRAYIELFHSNEGGYNTTNGTINYYGFRDEETIYDMLRATRNIKMAAKELEMDEAIVADVAAAYNIDLSERAPHIVVKVFDMENYMRLWGTTIGTLYQNICTEFNIAPTTSVSTAYRQIKKCIETGEPFMGVCTIRQEEQRIYGNPYNIIIRTPRGKVVDCIDSAHAPASLIEAVRCGATYYGNIVHREDSYSYGFEPQRYAVKITLTTPHACYCLDAPEKVVKWLAEELCINRGYAASILRHILEGKSTPFDDILTIEFTNRTKFLTDFIKIYNDNIVAWREERPHYVFGNPYVPAYLRISNKTGRITAACILQNLPPQLQDTILQGGTSTSRWIRADEYDAKS